MYRATAVTRFWVLFALLFVLIALEGGVALYVLADFKQSVEELRAMQAAGMRIDEFGLVLNNFVKEMKVSTGVASSGLGDVALPAMTNLSTAAQDLAASTSQIHLQPLSRLLAGVNDLGTAVAGYGGNMKSGARDDATLAYIQTIEPLADRLLSVDFPASRAGILAQVALVTEANDRSGVFARRVLAVSLAAALAVALFLARLIWASLNQAAAQERELERRASELDIAHSIQTSVLPRDLGLTGFDVGAIMVTSEEVGGDFYEFRRTNDGGAWLAIGDVTGHGLSSGLVMLMAQSMFSMLSEEEGDPSPKRFFERLNRSMYFNLRQRLREDKYMTLMVARVFPDGRMLYAGAHTELLVYRSAQDRVDRIPTEGIWLGLVEDAADATVDQELRLEPGDVALFHTDGMTEAKDAQGRVFDLDRLGDRLREWHAERAPVIVGRMADAARAWAPVPADDISLMVIARKALDSTS